MGEPSLKGSNGSETELLGSPKVGMVGGQSTAAYLQIIPNSIDVGDPACHFIS